MRVEKIVYTVEKDQDELESFLENKNFYFVKKVESEMNPEIWVDCNPTVLSSLIESDYLSKDEAAIITDNNVRQIIFYR